MRLAAIVALLALQLVACAEDEFVTAQGIDSIEGYEAYVAENPESIYQTQIDRRLEELYFQKAEAEPTAEIWEAYAAKFPEGKHQKEANEALQVYAWEETTAAGTTEAYKAFLDKYPKAEKTRRKKAEGMVRVSEYALLTAAEPKVTEVNMAEDPKGEKNGWGITSEITNGGDKALEYVNITLEYLADDGSILDRKDWPLVSKTWSVPVEDIAMQPMKPGEKRTWAWSISKEGAPAGWNQKVKLYPSNLKPVGEADAAAEGGK